MVRQGLHIFCIVLVGFVFSLLVIFIEKELVLKEIVIPLPGVTLPEWMDDFKYWTLFGIGAATFASLVWYTLFQWIFKVNHWSTADRRVWWYLFFLLPIILIVAGWIAVREAQEGTWLANICFILNNIGCYYLATALFSPVSFKYTPLGASKFRKW
jgi:MFS family permease